MEVILVVGKICSGKNHYASRFPSSFLHIDIGDVVRELTKTNARTHDESLENQIIDRLCQYLVSLDDRAWQGAVFTGFRQKNIIHSIYCWSKHVWNFNPKIVHLHVPKQELEIRYFNSNRAKDKGMDFEQALALDDKLGYSAMIESIYKNYQVHKLNYS